MKEADVLIADGQFVRKPENQVENFQLLSLKVMGIDVVGGEAIVWSDGERNKQDQYRKLNKAARIRQLREMVNNIA